MLMPAEDQAWGGLGTAFPDWQASGPEAILQPPKPEIIRFGLAPMRGTVHAGTLFTWQQRLVS